MSRLPIRTLGDVTNRQNLPASALPTDAAAEKSSGSRLPLSSRSVNQAQTKKFLNFLNVKQLRQADVLPAFLQRAGLLSSPTGSQNVAPWSSHTVVDLGCDDGKVSFLLHDLLPLSTVIGIDLSQTKVEDLREKRTALLKEEGRWAPVEVPYPDPDIEEDQQEILMFHQFDYHKDKLFELVRGPPPGGLNPFGGGPALGPALNTLSKPRVYKGVARAVVCAMHSRRVQLSTLFYAITSLSHTGVAYLLITGQHQDMLAVHDEDVKSQPSLQTYSVGEITSESEKWGYKPIKNWEKKVETADLTDQTGGKRWLGRKCWFAVAFELNQ